MYQANTKYGARIYQIEGRYRAILDKGWMGVRYIVEYGTMWSTISILNDVGHRKYVNHVTYFQSYVIL